MVLGPSHTTMYFRQDSFGVSEMNTANITFEKKNVRIILQKVTDKYKSVIPTSWYMKGSFSIEACMRNDKEV